MGNMRPPKDTGQVKSRHWIAVVCLLFLLACRSPFEPQGGDEAGPDPLTGTILLAINRPSLGRTILPTWPQDIEFRLDFVAQTGGNADFSVYRDPYDGNITVDLSVGDWDLEVSALLPPRGEQRAVARSGVYPLSVPTTETLEVLLLPIAEDGGYGRFEWDIGFIPSSAVTARMEIMDWHSDGPLTPPRAYYLIGGASPLGSSAGIELPAGLYRVHLTAANARGEEIAESLILHVYQNLLSRFYGESAIFAFPASLLNFILDAWNGGTGTWTFAPGTAAGHFRALGIEGTTGVDIADIADWFNRLSFAGGVYQDLDDLKVLFDAALIGMGATGNFLDADNYPHRGYAEAAIRALARNTDNPDYIGIDWADDGTTATVSIGPYTLTIVFSDPMPRPALGNTLAEQLEWLRGNAQDDGRYAIRLTGGEYISPAQAALPSGRTNLAITLIASAQSEIRLSANGSLFTVGSGLTFVLGENITLVGRSIDGNGGEDNTAPLVQVNSGGILEMNAGARITGNTATGTDLGGGVLVADNATFIMRGGEISENTASGVRSSGGVRVIGTGSTFTMYAGKISGNTAAAPGGFRSGGVSVAAYAMFTMRGGKISDNSLLTNMGSGGVIVMDTATFVMYGGEISGNTIASGTLTTGGVLVNAGSFLMRGGGISGNTNDYGRGGVWVAVGSTFQIENGIIHGEDAEDGLRNTALASMGAALFVSDSTAQYGTFDPVTGEFTQTHPGGTLTTTDLTIEVRNGELIRPIRATVSFDGNGHTVGTVPNPIWGLAGTYVQIPARGDLERGDLFFVGWNTSADATGTAFFAGGSPLVIVDRDVTLYAIWSEFEFDRASGTITDFSGTDLELVIPPTINTVAVTAIGDSAFWERQLISVVIPYGVTSIGNNAFRENQLISVDIPDSVTHIGNGAFQANQLTSVVIPDSVTHIGGNAFAGNQLIYVVIPDSVTFIGGGAFTNNQLIYVVIPDSITSIEPATFWNNQLTYVVIPDSVTTIGMAAFRGNQLTSVVIPDGVMSIGMQAFHANQLTSVVIPDSVTSIWAGAFANNQLIYVVIPDSVTSIGDGTFQANQLTSVVIPDSVTVIGNTAFHGNQLISVVIPDSVTVIGNNAFRENQLISVVIPDSVTTIGEGAFWANTLTSITMPGNVDISPPPTHDLSLHTMGTHGESFLAFYNDTGRRAGIYTFVNGEWTFYRDAAFTITFAQIQDMAPTIPLPQPISLSDPAHASTTVYVSPPPGGGFDSIAWYFDGASPAPTGTVSADGTTLTLDARIHRNQVRTHFVTLEVEIGGRLYSRLITFSVVP